MLLFSVVAYLAIFSWTYQYLCAPVYAYYGLSFKALQPIYLLLSWVGCIIPALWMPTTSGRPSQLLFLVLYFTIYIPSILLAHHVSLPEIPLNEALLLQFFIFIGLSIIQVGYFMPLVKLKTFSLNAGVFWVFFSVAMVVLFAYVLFYLLPNFKIANLSEIYEVRYASFETIMASGRMLGYALMWLGGFFLPFCFAVGAFSRRYFLVIVSFAGYILLFGLQGNKTTLFAPVFLSAVYIWSTRSGRNPTSVLAWALSCLLALPLFLGAILPDFILKWYVAIVHFRTFGIPSLMFFQHYDFFHSHEVTHMSHVTGIHFLLDNPYLELGIPKTIGLYYYGRPVGANAVFWGADGLAGFGLPGIVLMSMVCATVFWLLDCLSREYDNRFVMVAMGFIASSFANVSLFTTLFSGGLFLLIACLYIMPEKGLLLCAHKSGAAMESRYVFQSPQKRPKKWSPA